MSDLDPLPRPRVRRKSGGGYYEEGDRVIARDLVGGNVDRIGTVGLIGSHANGEKYITIRYGEHPFVEAFICRRQDIVEDLPDDNPEAIKAWLDKENDQ